MENELKTRVFVYWLYLPESDFLFNASLQELLDVSKLLSKGN